MEMELFQHHKVVYEHGKPTIILYLNDNLTEFSDELGHLREGKKKSLQARIQQYISSHIPNMKAATVKVVAGTMLLTTFAFDNTQKAEAGSSYNMGYLFFGSTNTMINNVDKTSGSMNEVSPSYFDINPDGSLKLTYSLNTYFIEEMHKRGLKVVPFLSNHWDREVGRAALQNRENISTEIANAIEKYNLDGVNVDIENVSDIDRDAYTDLVRLLREKLPQDKLVTVAVAANPNGWTRGWHGSYDYNKLSQYSDYLMIMSYDESYYGSDPGPVASQDFVERSVKYALAEGVPAEKIVLGIAHYGRYWRSGDAIGGFGISNNQVAKMLETYSHVTTLDEKSKSMKATVTINPEDPSLTVSGRTLAPGTYTVWYENEQSIAAKVDLIDMYNLKGTGHWSLGQESQDLWVSFKEMIKEDLLVMEVNSSPKQIATALKNVNFRESPSTSSSIIKTFHTGSSFIISGEKVTAEGYSWIGVQTKDGRKGYVASDFVKEITPKEYYGKSRYDTSVKISEQGWPEGASYVILGRGDLSIDALAGSVLAKKYDSPLLLTNNDKVPDIVEKEITRLQPSKIFLLGGEGAISKSVEDELIGKGYEVERIQGKSRYDTSAKIAKAIGQTKGEIILSSGNENSPDSLSVAPYAGISQTPIILTQRDKLSIEVEQYIKEEKVAKVTIIGGSGAISEQVVQRLKEIGVEVIERVAGSNRYDTSIEVAKHYKDHYNSNEVFVVSGKSFVDALSGAPLAARNQGPIILVSDTIVPIGVKAWLETEVDGPINFNFLGGYSIIPSEVRHSLINEKFPLQ